MQSTQQLRQHRPRLDRDRQDQLAGDRALNGQSPRPQAARHGVGSTVLRSPQSLLLLPTHYLCHDTNHFSRH